MDKIERRGKTQKLRNSWENSGLPHFQGEGGAGCHATKRDLQEGHIYVRAVILVKNERGWSGGPKTKEKPLIPLDIYVLMVVVGLSDGPHSCTALEIETH